MKSQEDRQDDTEAFSHITVIFLSSCSVTTSYHISVVWSRNVSSFLFYLMSEG